MAKRLNMGKIAKGLGAMRVAFYDHDYNEVYELADTFSTFCGALTSRPEVSRE